MRDYSAMKLGSIRLTLPPIHARIHYRIMHVRTLIARRMDRRESSLSHTLFFFLRFFLSFLPSRVQEAAYRIYQKHDGKPVG